MHFLVEMVEKKYPELMDVADELIHVDKAARGEKESQFIVDMK